jgi:hypothetical protein
MALTTDNWIGSASADWGASSANWSAGLPDSNDNVVIDTAAVLTVSYGGGDNFVVNALVVDSDFFVMSGGSLTITKTASFADGFTQTAGTLTAGGKVTVDGAGALTGGAAEGDTAFTFDGTVALADYLLGGAAVLNNLKTTNETGSITLGDNTGVGATIDNTKGAAFDLAGDFGIARGAASAKFVNAGSLAKTAGTDTSLIQVNTTDTGTISVATGTLEFDGPDNSFAGAITGAGQFALGGSGTSVIDPGTTIKTAVFTIYYLVTTVTLGENLSYAGTFNLENTSILDLAGFTLTLSGTDAFTSAGDGPPIVDGTGTLVTLKGSDSGIDAATLGGTVDWENAGTVGETAALTIGDASFNAATFTNEKGGIYEFTTDSGIDRGAAFNSIFVNDAGATLEKTVGNGDSVVAVDYSGGGAIVVKTGEIEFEGASGSFAGAVSGAGQFALGAGSSDLVAAGASITTASFMVTDPLTLVTLGENLGYAGAFTGENSATLDLAGFTLTLSGDTTLNSATIDGQGLLVTAHGGAVGLTDVLLGGTVVWENAGTISEFGTLTIGDGSFDTASFINEKGGVFDLTNNDGIVIGEMPTSSFVNAAGATFEKTAGTGDSLIQVGFTDDGAVAVESGTLEFGLGVTGSGSFAIASGALLRFDASVGKGSSVYFATTTGELMLPDAVQFAAAIRGFGGSDTLDLDVDFFSPRFKLAYAGNAAEGVLTATDGTHTAHLSMVGDYKTADFHASADGFNGVLIVDPAAHSGSLAVGR